MCTPLGIVSVRVPPEKESLIHITIYYKELAYAIFVCRGWGGGWLNKSEDCRAGCQEGGKLETLEWS